MMVCSGFSLKIFFKILLLKTFPFVLGKTNNELWSRNGNNDLRILKVLQISEKLLVSTSQLQPHWYSLHKMPQLTRLLYFKNYPVWALFLASLSCPGLYRKGSFQSRVKYSRGSQFLCFSCSPLFQFIYHIFSYPSTFQLDCHFSPNLSLLKQFLFKHCILLFQLCVCFLPQKTAKNYFHEPSRRMKRFASEISVIHTFKTMYSTILLYTDKSTLSCGIFFSRLL